MTALEELPDDEPEPLEQAEEGVIAAVLKSPATIGRLLRLEPDDFADKRNSLVWRAMRALYERHVPVDYTTVSAELEKAGDYKQAGGLQYLASINLAGPLAANAEHYAATIEAAAFRRRLKAAAVRITQLANKPAIDIAEMATLADGLLQAARPKLLGQDLFSPEEWADNFLSDLELRSSGKRTATSLPWAELRDMAAGGFEPGELILLMATSGSGKTEMAFQIAMFATQAGPVVYASLEQSDVELAHRYARIRKGLSASDMARGQLSDRQSADALEVMNEMQADDLWPVSPAGAFTTADLHARCQEVQARTGRKLTLVVGDYAQRFADSSGRKGANREQDMALVAERLKSLAREMRVPVLVPIQPNRMYEGRPNKRPRMADLRESGRFEIEADWILGMYRPDKHEEDEQKKVAMTRASGQQYWPMVEVWVLKNRSGRGDVDGRRQLRWTGSVYVDPLEAA